MLHKGNGGPDSRWAESSKSGDKLIIAGPGLIKRVGHDADWFFIVGDMTALPAMSCNLEQLPATAKGYAFIEVMSEQDIQDIKVPVGINVQWIINNHHHQHPEVLREAVYDAEWLKGSPSVWCACEFNTMRALGTYFKQERQVDKQNIYISSYWKSGNTEDQHKAVKRDDKQRDQSQGA